MPAPKLRHYKVRPGTANTATPVHAAVPPDRALVISKITVAHDNSSAAAQQFSLFIGPHGVGGVEDRIAILITLNVGEVYTETNLVALAGEAVHINAVSAIGPVIHVFGEEVDN